MANRDKKITISRKQNCASPLAPKENLENSIHIINSALNADGSPSLKTTKRKIKTAAPKKATLVANKLEKNVTKPAANKKLAISFKSKVKNPPKINQKLAKALLNSVKKLECKKATLLGNGIKKPRGKKKIIKKVENMTQGDIDDTPPLLEPILPLDRNVVIRKYTKRAYKKTPVLLSEDEANKNIKTEPEPNSLTVVKPIKRPKQKKLVKIEPVPVPEVKSESLEDVMNDLSFLITKSEVKTEPEEKLPPNPKSKRTITRKSKLELFKKRTIKQEKIEKILSDKVQIDPSANSLIDMLDLNVTKIKVTSPGKKRRHSIEKFPLSFENAENSSFVFSSIPRSRSPKVVKRVSKIRQSCDILPLRRMSPYSTRSDSPARILRNGKHRSLKSGLLEGLDTDYKKRRRLCSDYSGSEKSVSKVSGYDSDSSFSDLASFMGGENVEAKDIETPIKLENKRIETVVTMPNLETESKPLELAPIKRTLSTENSLQDITQNVTDTNCNVFQDIKSDDKDELINNNLSLVCENSIKTESNTYDNLLVQVNEEIDVIEKEVILDIMKQTFNNVEQEKRATRSSTRKTEKSTDDEEFASMSAESFYGSAIQQENNCKTEISSNIQKDVVEFENCNSNEFLQENENFPNKPENEENEIVDILGNFSPVKEIDKEKTSFIENTEEIKELPETGSSYFQNISESISTTEKDKKEIIETPENLAIKENILQALGLQSLKAAEEAKQRVKEKTTTKQDYTGTLKTVIKLNRCEKKKSRSTLKMTLQKTKSKGRDSYQDSYGVEEDLTLKSCKENNVNWRSTSGGQTSDTAGAQRKSHYSNRSNIMDGSSEHTSDGDMATNEGEDSGKILVIPEKASSFSIHPGRLCKDECSYCFGKFGLFDTPCHIAQIKSVERQDRILATEKHLTRDSCLCDACYRHVDRKSNTPSYTNKASKRSSIVAPGPRQNYCHVLGCNTIASNILRRKWIIKMRKNVCQVINIDLDNPGLHSIPICEEHFAALEHLMVCAMCKRRLARNHIHYLGPEVTNLNDALLSEGVPIKLTDKPIVCKLCRYFATIILKPPQDRPESSADFFKDYKKRLLHFNDLEVMDEAASEKPISVPTKERYEKDQVKKRKKTPKNQSIAAPSHMETQIEVTKHEQRRVPSESNSSSNDKSRSESPTEYMIDYNTLVPKIAMECGSDIETPKKEIPVRNPVALTRIQRPESVKEAVEISKKMNIAGISSKSSVVQRLGANPSISVRQLFPGEEEMGLHANIEFNNVRERTPEGWEKCISTIQYDLETKQLWQDLQKPYGNLSSFLRHLIILEKYYRNGDLVLSANASSHSINYSESVQNRLRAYDNIPSNPPSYIHSVKKSSSGIITTKEPPYTFSTTINAANIPKNTPITFSQISNLTACTATSTSLSSTMTSTKQRNPGLPPGLISLHPGTTRPVAPLVKVSQTQKIKIPLTKNWRPNLIPIDPNKKPDKDKKMEYVKVISGGKPYHITLEDYHRICAIKRSCDLKQKKMQEAAKAGSSVLKQVHNTSRKNTVSHKSNTKNEPIIPDGHEVENSLKKLDETVEKLESKLSETKSLSQSSSPMALPKIPKSLTVIPQTVSRKSANSLAHKNKSVLVKTSTSSS